MPQFSQRPRGLLEPYAGMTGTYGSEGGPPQQCGGPTRHQDLLRGLLRGRFVVGAFDEFAVLESSAGADQCHQVGCVDRAPA